MEFISPRKKMAMGKMSRMGKRVNMDKNKGRSIDGPSQNLSRRSKRVSTPTKAIGQSMITAGKKLTRKDFI